MFYKKSVLKISQYSQENTCARASFLKKLQASICNFSKKVTLTQVFSCEIFAKFLRTSFLQNTSGRLPVITESWDNHGRKSRSQQVFYGLSICTIWKTPMDRSNHHRCSIKKAVLKNSAIFTGKNLCWSLFLINLQALTCVLPFCRYQALQG